MTNALMNANDTELRANVDRWINADPDASTRDELRKLLASADLSKTDLADRFAGSLEFGTAGLRGVMGAGPNRMNRAVVLRTTQGFAAYIREAVKEAPSRGVVIGYDGRKMSREFAEDAACVLASAGIAAFVFADYAPTPLTAYAVTKMGAAAGIMITASHNPPEYNGYKAYWTNGAQIISPIDIGIAKKIDLAPSAKDVPRMNVADARAKGLVKDVPTSVIDAYLADVLALGVNDEGDRTMTIVYTPMHGVGDKLARKAFDEAKFTNVTSVPEQQKPDGAFPTVAFPNPEEKGAMDLSFALARKLNAELVLANDPDADRLAVALPSKDAAGGYVQLTGNQVGILLGHYLLTEKKPSNKPRLVLASIVSSPMLGVIAKELGVRYEETLTGFKWIANRAMDLEARDGVDFVFGYEEALGYTVGDVVRDKDGISAAKMVAEMAVVLKSRGRTLLSELESLYRKYGLFVSSQVSITKKGHDGAEQIKKMMSALRELAPTRIGAHDVSAILDYDAQEKNDVRDGARSKLELPRSNVLTFELESGSRVIARPSGTEPKVKFYFDVRERMQSADSLVGAETRANAMMKELADAFVKLAVP